MKSTILAVVAIAAIAGTAFFAWQQTQALAEAKAALAAANAERDKAVADARAMRAQTDALRKEADDAKQAADEARSELNSARVFLEAEKQATLRLREEANQLRQQLASAGRSAPRAASLPPGLVPLLAPQQPLRVQAVNRGAAIGVGVPAR